MAQKDVFLNIAGGLKVNDPAIDLAVISAILSSNMDTEIEAGVCMAGEVGLSGEIRPVNRIEQRISEAEKLGFTRMLIPKHNLQGLDRKKNKNRTYSCKEGRRSLPAVIRMNKIPPLKNTPKRHRLHGILDPSPVPLF